MFNFFKKTKKTEKKRDIFSLSVGDFITFAYDKNKDISDLSFEVTECITYFYGEVFYPEFIIKNNKGEILFLSIEKDDGETVVTITKKIPVKDLSSAFTDKFHSFFSSTESILHINEYFTNHKYWICNTGYSGKNKGSGHFLSSDVRHLHDFGAIDTLKEPFEYFFCMTKCEKYGIECEKYSSNSEYSFFIHRDEYVIEEILFKND